jgi:hypothetical protein
MFVLATTPILQSSTKILFVMNERRLLKVSVIHTFCTSNESKTVPVFNQVPHHEDINGGVEVQIHTFLTLALDCAQITCICTKYLSLRSVIFLTLQLSVHLRK